MCVTGVLLTYEKQIISWADTRGYRSAPPTPETQHLPVETLIAKAREARGANPTSVTLKSDPPAPAEIGFGRETHSLRQSVHAERSSAKDHPGSEAFFAE